MKKFTRGCVVRSIWANVSCDGLGSGRCVVSPLAERGQEQQRPSESLVKLFMRARAITINGIICAPSASLWCCERYEVTDRNDPVFPLFASMSARVRPGRSRSLKLPRAAKVERVSQILQLAVIVESRRPLSTELQLPQELDFL
jgi:hypothetical protein